ncbi:hypothetical protein PMIN06_007996 [Paraphaeosphaeria minitans]|uniref:Uncharacterized protein n=1 Tax=Paraphaeosphaeria minitans TaxID=565426 RepID=A0A9P6GU43_9PLEO|nr:hypothetical protein PMIN01_01430 [Paraphaeosphaeria minitans]
MKLKLDAIVHQHLDDWRLMIGQERMYMMQGPTITIYIGGKPAVTTWKRAAMAVSRTLNGHFTANPESTRFDFAPGDLTRKAVYTLLRDWLQKTGKEFEAHEVLLHNQHDIAQAREDVTINDFELDMAVLWAARVLGMEKYTDVITQYYLNYIRTGMPHHMEIACVEEMRASPENPLWTTMINRLTYLRHTNQIKDPKKFSIFLKKHPILANCIESADLHFRCRAASNGWDYDEQVHQEDHSTTGPGGDYMTAHKGEISAEEAVMMWIESPDPVLVLYQAL